ncbi:hypothetical protein NT6N_24530 [Oceaniferula spumae]|uniref:Uncharacterized protein n=1 Tax=Oceaniferula spumae TaxID=2979115 RepID=A0AAT9FN78_9BACT
MHFFFVILLLPNVELNRRCDKVEGREWLIP